MTSTQAHFALEHLKELRPLIELPEGIAWFDIVSKYLSGVDSHLGEPSLREMSDLRLKKEIKDEECDLLIYKAELKRREGLK